MSITLFDQSGRQIRLGEKLGTGGEATVYAAADNPQIVIKLYHPGRHIDADKLSAMVSASHPALQNIAAWPIAAVHKQVRGPAVGFMMPRIRDGFEIHELYSPTARQSRFPDATWRFLVHVAANCARALACLHSRNIVMGDVNQKNFMVHSNGTIHILDCDSFQVQVRGQSYLCRVGVPEFTAPELHGLKLESVLRTENHDCFGLATLIFHLLFMGRHPYSGRYLGTGDMPLDRAIREGRFAYSSNGHQLAMLPPPRAPTLTFVTPEIAQCFQAAFAPLNGSSPRRPSSARWAAVLGDLESKLIDCKTDIGHEYPRALGACPWCQLVAGGGANYFYTASIRKRLGSGPKIDVDAVWKEITAITEPSVTFSMAFSANGGGSPTQMRVRREAAIDQDAFSNVVYSVSVAAAAATLFSPFLPSMQLFTVPIAIAFGGWWITLVVLSVDFQEYRRRQQELRECSSNLKKLHVDCAQDLGSARGSFRSHLSRLKGLHSEYAGLNQQRTAELSRLKSSLAERQKEEHLKKHFIRDAKIPGIGNTRIVTLASNGIETAFDISSGSILAIDGFGQTLLTSLMEWRRTIELKFVFNPSAQLSRFDMDAVELKYLAGRRRIETELSAGLNTLKNLQDKAKRIESDAMDPLRAAYEKQRVAQQGLEEFNSVTPKWPVKAIILVAIMTCWIPVYFGAKPTSHDKKKVASQIEPHPAGRDTKSNTVANTGQSPVANPVKPEISKPPDLRGSNDKNSTSLQRRQKMPTSSDASKNLSSSNLVITAPTKKADSRSSEEYRKGQHALRNFDYIEAINWFGQAQEQWPMDPIPSYFIAISQRRAGNLPAAEDALKQAVELEKIAKIDDWGSLMERVQGAERQWLQSARTKR